MKPMTALIFAALVSLGVSASARAAEPAPDACVECHKDEKFSVQNKKLYDYFQEWQGSAHDRAGLSCTACHGGDSTKPTQEEAHKGILPQSHPDSPFHFRNIPKTCGGCHPQIQARFEKSRHYEMLKTKGQGPSCVTCHGSLDTRVYYNTVVERSCARCHNAKTKNHPEVAAQAKEILGRLNHANGYRKGLAFYYKSIGKPQAMSKVDKAYADIVEFWHEFNFKKLGPRSQEFLAETRRLYDAAQHERKDQPEKP